MIINITFT